MTKQDKILLYDKIKELIEDLHETKAVFQELNYESIYKVTEDFEHGNYRFIHEDDIDNIMKEELKNDTYVLGCFNSWFIADITGIEEDAVKKMQENDCCEALGLLMEDRIDEVVESYVAADGYGHHFSHYDHSEEYSKPYYIFRIN